MVINIYPKYITYGESSLEEVLPYVGTIGKKSYRYCVNEYNVNVRSHRLQCFKKNNICVGCGLVGILFRLQSDLTGQNPIPHFNLYGIVGSSDALGRVEGSEIIFTKDHIVPKSKGGKDSLSNYQTMCYDCNRLKGAS